MKTTSKFLLGFIGGTLAGAAIGLLFAPEKGEDTRKIIMDTIDEYSKKGKEFVDNKRASKESSEE